MPGLVMFWGWVFLLTTLYVWFFKPEKAFKAPAAIDAESGTELLKGNGGDGGGSDGDDDEGGEEEYLTISEAFRQFRLVFLVNQIKQLGACGKNNKLLISGNSINNGDGSLTT